MQALVVGGSGGNSALIEVLLISKPLLFKVSHFVTTEFDNIECDPEDFVSLG